MIVERSTEVDHEIEVETNLSVTLDKCEACQCTEFAFLHDLMALVDIYRASN
jgi:hypothetical protein